MCGITGIISRHSLAAGDVDRVRAADQAMLHRGPNGKGEFPETFSADTGLGNVFLAMRRLSIIDLEGGWQPLYNEDRTLALVANGEIYNFVELREDLRARGHTFRTGSDCETILHLYEQYGLDFVHHLRGMFAFALWDMRTRRLVVGRDRMGEKPLYLHSAGERIFFASEMKALLASGMVPFELEPCRVHEYLHYGWVPEPQTMVRGVSKLAPGHLLIVDLDPWRVEDRTYWSFDAAPPIKGDPGQLIRAELETIAEQIIRSDVPVGLALSGGLDSSLIAALATKKYTGPMHAFSVGYTNRPRQDERDMAKGLAIQLGMPFHEIEISTQDMLDFFPEIHFWRDDPIADIAGYGYFLLSKNAHENGCPVLIQGQGADELFWGYRWSVRAVEHSRNKLGGRRASSLSSFLAHLPRGFSPTHAVQAAYLLGGMLYGWKQLVPAADAPDNQLAFYDLDDTYQIGAYAAHRTYTRSFAERVGTHSAAAFFQAERPWQHVDILIMRLLCGSYLLQNGIAQGDRLSMANSVELRLPLVDYKLVELVVGLQKTCSSYDLSPKAWLKDAVRDILPADIMDRPKRGFNPPVTSWIEAIRSKYGMGLLDGYLVQNEVLDPRMAARLGRSASRFSPWNDLFFKYIGLEFWCRSMQQCCAGAGQSAYRHALETA